jgi:hypothetical protein
MEGISAELRVRTGGEVDNVTLKCSRVRVLALRSRQAAALGRTVGLGSDLVLEGPEGRARSGLARRC